MQRVAHDRICHLFELHVSHDGLLFGMILELFAHGNLAERIKNSVDGRMREFEVIQMAFNVLSALEYMHEKKVIHRDIKPANIMLTEVDGQHVYKLIDFSVSAVELLSREEVSSTLQTGTTTLQGLGGTYHYMSPEQFDERKVVSTQTDLWSLGVVVFESLSGTLPFGQDITDRNQISYSIVNNPPQELSEVVDDVDAVSDGVAAFVMRTLQKDLTQRFSSATMMMKALDETIKTPGGTAFDLFISYRVWCDKLFAEALYKAASACQLKPGRENRLTVYLDKVRIVDGQRFDENFAKGLANSTVFAPLFSASCLKNVVE
eukprot:COSAG06_NODE_14351_length_1164_cov_1.058216_2_plen_318_part_01